MNATILKRALSVVLQTMLLLLVAVFGMFWRPVHFTHVISSTGSSARQYEFDWLLCVVVAYGLLLLAGLLTGKLRRSWVTSTAAIALTLLIVLCLTRIGYRDGIESTLRPPKASSHRIAASVLQS